MCFGVVKKTHFDTPNKQILNGRWSILAIAGHDFLLFFKMGLTSFEAQTIVACQLFHKKNEKMTWNFGSPLMYKCYCQCNVFGPFLEPPNQKKLKKYIN